MNYFLDAAEEVIKFVFEVTIVIIYILDIFLDILM